MGDDAPADKLIGDEVMALYLPMYGRFEEAAPVMLDHARGLLRAIGYAARSSPQPAWSSASRDRRLASGSSWS